MRSAMRYAMRNAMRSAKCDAKCDNECLEDGSFIVNFVVFTRSVMNNESVQTLCVSRKINFSKTFNYYGFFVNYYQS